MIPVLVPKAPNADALMPYLRRIDSARWYSNGGPLVRELEVRMGGVAVSSATLGLELAARCIFKKRVRIPAFTFVATATAMLRAGLDPVICDVDPETWALKSIDDQSLPVCPFGAPVTPGGLVDAAAGVGSQFRGNRVFSLHATKALPAGEGGMVCGDPRLLERVERLANFGMDGKKIVVEAGTNAKMSEYHAAVALAGLDVWGTTVQLRAATAAAYLERLGPDIGTLPNAGVYTAFPVVVDDAARVQKAMAARGVETRRWYTPTIDRHPAFAHLEREDSLVNAHRLADTVLCLPFHLRLSMDDIDQVCDVFRWAMARRPTLRKYPRPTAATAERTIN